jgi:hypothetical protein
MKEKLELTQVLLNGISESLSQHPRKIKKIKPCRIKFMGNFISTESGKTLWRRKGDAKLAFLNHLESSFKFKKFLMENNICNDRTFYYIDFKELKHELEKSGYIEYIEIDE